MNSYYDNLNANFDYSIYGILPQESANEFKIAWERYVKAANPLTREIYNTMNDDQRNEISGGRPMVFGMSGGLWVISGGSADSFWSALNLKWSRAAEDWAREHRKQAGWKRGTNGKYLTDPNGNTKTHGVNGRRYGSFSMPWEMHSRGDFDGVITDDTDVSIFTK